MQPIQTTSWEDFEEKLRHLRAEYGSKESSPLIFRGQSNSEWELTTTLDGNTARQMTFLDYYDLITGAVGPEVKTFSGVDVPERDQETAMSFFKEDLLFTFPVPFPDMKLYRYMAYLRHLGFPSPLLDWTRSPYVAAFFAFREDPMVNIDQRSIYVYCERPTGGKGGGMGDPWIFPLGPYVQTHHRHFRQRCYYTFCARFDVSYAQWRFESHETVFNSRRIGQDFLWKFNIPSKERAKVLQILSDYNLNAFSLFGSEESLLETMWLREYVLKTWGKDGVVLVPVKGA